MKHVVSSPRDKSEQTIAGQTQTEKNGIEPEASLA